MREPDVFWQFGVDGVVVEVVADVREVGAPRGELLHDLDGAGQVGVTRVRLTAQSIEDEEIQIFQQGITLLRDVTHVGKVRCGAKAVAGDRMTSMRDGDAKERSSKELDRCVLAGGNTIHVDTGAGGITINRAEGVVEDSLDDLCGCVVSVESDPFRTSEAERTKVIHAEDVVGVCVCVENGIDGMEVFADGLCMEVLAGVDQDVVIVIGEPCGRSCAAVQGAWLMR